MFPERAENSPSLCESAETAIISRSSCWEDTWWTQASLSSDAPRTTQASSSRGGIQSAITGLALTGPVRPAKPPVGLVHPLDHNCIKKNEDAFIPSSSSSITTVTQLFTASVLGSEPHSFGLLYFITALSFTPFDLLDKRKKMWYVKVVNDYSSRNRGSSVQNHIRNVRYV